MALGVGADSLGWKDLGKEKRARPSATVGDTGQGKATLADHWSSYWRRPTLSESQTLTVEAGQPPVRAGEARASWSDGAEA